MKLNQVYAIFVLSVCPIIMKLDMFLMAPEPILMAYFMNPFHQFVYIPLSLLGNVTVHMFPRQRILEIRKSCWTVVFYAVRVVSKGSTRLLFLELFDFILIDCNLIHSTTHFSHIHYVMSVSRQIREL
jgi:hypothetical protein